MQYDIIIIGSGPGGYVAAIRASQLGFKVAVVEKSEIGGVCLNWGCIPTKALLKSAQVYSYISHAAEYGIKLNGEAEVDFEAIIKRSRSVADGMNKGVQYLLKKNNITVINGFGKLSPTKSIIVTAEDSAVTEYTAKHIILATGARSKVMPNLVQDGKKIIGYREAMTLPKLPKSMVVVGSGAIGSEFANFYALLGTEVTLVEFLPNIVPNEDEEVSKLLGRSFRKLGIKTMTNSSVESVSIVNDQCSVTVKTAKGEEIIVADIVLSAVGVVTNLEGLGLEEAGIITEKTKVIVDDYYRTNIEGIYAIGDIVKGPALAHVASAEAIVCVEKIGGLNPEPINYNNIPACTYTSPEIASVGLTEQKAIDAGYEIKIGKFPYTASGKASASGKKDGFVKMIYDAKYGELLGAHLVGDNATEMIAELVLGRKLETTGHEIMKAIHPHPTMSEAIMEATAAAYDEVIHL